MPDALPRYNDGDTWYLVIWHLAPGERLTRFLTISRELALRTQAKHPGARVYEMMVWCEVADGVQRPLLRTAEPLEPWAPSADSRGDLPLRGDGAERRRKSLHPLDGVMVSVV